MQPIQLAIAAILGLLALAYVLYPLYRWPTEQKVASGSSNLSDREQNARQALREVEFDFQLGNLNEKDYRSMRTRYMNRALAEMKSRHAREQEIDEEIENELRKLKADEQREAENSNG
jgi:cytochrome c-type biogenesis protein CcmH/NrfG